MSNEVLQQVKALVKKGEIDYARDLLEAMPDDPTAQRWLGELNKRYPPPNRSEKLWQSDSHDTRLIEAQQLLQQGRYKEARWKLAQLRNNEIAQQWLRELDEIERRQKQEAAAREFAATYKPDSPAQRIGDFVRSTNFNVGVGSLMMALCLAQLVMWMMIPWIKGPDLLTGTRQELECAPVEIVAGRLDCQRMGYIDPELFARGNTGFISVRLVDRFLAVIPLLAIIGLVFAWSYAAQRAEVFNAYAVLLAVGVGLAAFPFAWEYFSGDNAANYTSIWRDLIEGTYQNTPYKVMGIISAAFIGLAAMLKLADLSGLLGVQKPTPLTRPESAANSGGGVFEDAATWRQRPR